MGRNAQIHAVSDLIARGVLTINDGYRAKNSELADHGIPFARAQNINDGFHFEDADRVPEAALGKIANKISEPGDVVFTSKGTVGRLAFVRDETPRFVYAPQLCFWRVLDGTIVDSHWLYYWMHSHEFFVQYKGVAGQTDMAEYVSLGDQRQMRLTLPPLAQQKKIAEILGTLDDKIELNRRINQTLEAMASAIFKSWFVDFDPVRGNAEGRKPAGLDAATAALFPDSFKNSPLGPIPKGWSVNKLAETTTKIGTGATPRGGSSVYLTEGIALIRSQNVYDHEFRWEGLAHISEQAADQLRGVTVEPQDVLLNITGDSILRTCVVDPTVLPARVNQHVAIIRACPSIPPHFLHLFLVSDEMKLFLLGFDTGATRPAITKGHLESVPVLVPPKPLLAEFQRLTDPIFAKIDRNRAESRILSEIRDALLPKMLSGDIRVIAVQSRPAEAIR